MPKELDSQIKKNLLDLQYNKYLQYYNTSIIIIFTYIIGVSISFVTKQVDYQNINQISAVTIISIPFLSIILMLIRKFKNHLTKIPQEIKKIKF